MTHSYARIVFVAGTPGTTTNSGDGPHDIAVIAKWHCGCQSTGPYRAMVWDPCESHDAYSSVLNHERTISLLSVWESESI